MEFPAKQLKTTGMFVPPNCRVVELGLHEILPVDSWVIPLMFERDRITTEELKVKIHIKKLHSASRQQNNGSTFAKDQMLSTTDDNKH